MKNSAIAIAAVALIAATLIGAGYAVTYYGVTETNSSMSFDEYAIRITSGDGQTQISTPIIIDGPTYTQVNDDLAHTTTITVENTTETPDSSYYLKIDGPTGLNLNVRAKIVMDDPGTWAIINNITLTAGSTNTVSWVPTGANWNEESRLFSPMTTGTYNLSISVTYKAVEFQDISTQAESLSFLNLGMKLVLALSDDDPVPQS